MRGCLAFIIILIFISISVCGCLDNGEVAITIPADEMILTESDFDNNWTSWWTSTEVEDEIEPLLSTILSSDCGTTRVIQLKSDIEI